MCSSVLYPLCRARPNCGNTCPIPACSVTRCLCEDGRGCDALDLCIAMHDGFARQTQVDRHGIRQQVIGSGRASRSRASWQGGMPDKC